MQVYVKLSLERFYGNGAEPEGAIEVSDLRRALDQNDHDALRQWLLPYAEERAPCFEEESGYV